MNFRMIAVLCSLFIMACNNKKKTTNTESYFPVLSFLKAQAKHVDTSLYRIVKLDKTGNGQSNTSYIKREEFRKVAAPFLNLPDIASDKWQDDYEETKMYDPALQQSIFTYTATDPELEVQRQDIILKQTQADSEVETIIVYQVTNEGDVSVVRNMVWYVNKRFTIVTKTQKKGSPETVQTTEVIWNDFTDAR